ncbi:MAG: M14 family metallocarboxypeptidase [Verrucomicrobiota bacterium]
MELLSHSGHDVERLLSRWEDLARRRGWQRTVLSEESGIQVLAFENEIAAPGSEGLYLSAGVHGDECAPVWGLIEWAESEGAEKFFQNHQVTLVPCINPHGLIENTRVDHAGRDLNRCFQDESVEVVGAWQSFLKGKRFRMAINLHEDYDAGGIYLYELVRGTSRGHSLLDVCENVIPRETASDVDGSEFDRGLLSRANDDDEVRQVAAEELDGWPEAIWLYLNHTDESLTFETPSEMALERRIAAHRSFIDAAVEVFRGRGIE